MADGSFTHLVVVGSSAGGIGALAAMVRAVRQPGGGRNPAKLRGEDKGDGITGGVLFIREVTYEPG